MPYKYFDPKKLILQPLNRRKHDIDRSVLIRPDDLKTQFDHPSLPPLAERIKKSAIRKRSIILAAGAHLLRRGNGPLIIDLMERGLITHLALNGAGAIHDFEMALIGETCESVARYIKTGQFGLWSETGMINEIVRQGRDLDLGLGEALGKYIEENACPFRKDSVLAAGFRLKVPVTVHVCFGQDIIHQHPNFDAASTGEATYRDFLVFTESVSLLEQGVFLNVGTAVMGPEVYLKALAMARNVASQKGQKISDFTTAVFDLHPLQGDLREEAQKDKSQYYFRPYKTVLVRTVAEGGTSYYIQGDHRVTFPALYDLLVEKTA